MEEVWKPVVGFEGYYEISSYGRVRSVERYVRQSNHLRYVPMKIKKIIPNRFGYPVVTLCRNRRSRQYGIHRLLAEAFIPNPENKPFVDHINTDITDFRLDNLRWVTAKENANNSLTLKHCRENTYTPERSKKIIESKRGKPYHGAPREVYQYTKCGQFVARYNSIREAEEAIGGKVGISRVLNDRTQSAGGYLWFTEEKDTPCYKRRPQVTQRAVVYCDVKGNVLGEYDSINDASRKTGIPPWNIFRSIRSNGIPRKYKFKYK